MVKRLALAIVFLLAAGAACGTSEGTTASTAAATGDAPAETAPQQESQEPTPASAQAASSVVDPDPDAPSMAGSSPIGAFFEEGGGFEAAIAEYTVKVEEQLVTCMAAQGFEFKRTSPEVAEIDRLQSELTVLEWTSQFGYGVSTSFDSVVAQQTSDPNAEILFSLSPAERDLWVFTLTGQEGFAAPAGDEAPPLEEQGCVGEAILATGGGDVIEGMEDFGSAYEEAEAALFDQREMVEAVDAWSRCMSEAGHPGFADRDAGENAIRERFDAIIAPLQAALGDIDPEDGRALIEGDTTDLEKLPGLDVAALRKLQDDEIALALADLGCYNDHVKAVYEPLRDDLERGLLTEYGGELDALRNLGS